MKISILQKNLKWGLSAAACVVGKNAALPILSNTLIKAESGVIKLIATDLEVGLVCNLRGKVEELGGISVDAKTFLNYSSLLPNEKIDIIKNENNIDVFCGKYKTKIIGSTQEDFPLMPEVKKELEVCIDKESFKRALSKTVFAAANNIRPELGGVLFNLLGNSLFLVGTDSYRLAENKLDVSLESGRDLGVIVPIKTISQVISLLNISDGDDISDENGLIKVYLSENQVAFQFNGMEITSKIIEGRFPDYQQIIPQNFKTVLTVNKDKLLSAVKAASIFSKTNTNDIKLKYSKGEINVYSSSQSGESEATIEADGATENGEIVLNYRYLLDGLNNFSSDKVELKIIDNNSPCLLSGGSDERFIYLIMPIK